MPVLVDAGTWRNGSGVTEHLRDALRRSSAVSPGVVDRWLAAGTIYVLAGGNEYAFSHQILRDHFAERKADAGPR